MKLQEKSVKIGKYGLVIHELTVEEEAEIKSESRTYDKKTHSFKLDPGALDALIIANSVDDKTWPSDFGEMSIENIRKLPSKYFRRLLIECQRLNSISEEVSDFLENQSSSRASRPKSAEQSG